jgi:hypothetical protein
MIRVAKEMQLDYPPEAVFDLLANVQNEGRWNTTVIRIEQVVGDHIGPGARFRGQYKGLGTLITDLTTYERPCRLGFHSAGRWFVMDFSFVFEPRAPGTIVHAIAEVQPQGLIRGLEPFMRGMLDREFSKRPGQIARALDRSRAAAQSGAMPAH